MHTNSGSPSSIGLRNSGFFDARLRAAKDPSDEADPEHGSRKSRFFDARLRAAKDPSDEADPDARIEGRMSWGDCVPFV